MFSNTCIYKTFPAWHPTIAAGVLAQVGIGFPTSVLLAQGSEGKFEMYEAKQVFNIEAYIPLRKNGLHGRRSYNSLASSKRTECDACGSTMRQKKNQNFYVVLVPLILLNCLVPCWKVDVERRSLQCTTAEVWWNSSRHALSCGEDV